MAETYTVGRGLVQSRPFLQGNDVLKFVALLGAGIRREPKPTTLTLGAAVTAGGDTPVAMTVTAVSGLGAGNSIPAGQYFDFIDGDGIERLAQATAPIQDGDTTVTALVREDIAASGVAQYPPFLWDRTDAQITNNSAITEVTTHNTGGNRDGTQSGRTVDIALPGPMNHYNAAYHTAKYAQRNRQEVWVRVELPKPSAAFSRGEVIQGAGAVTARPLAAPTNGQVSSDLTVGILGQIFEEDAA